jgi:hypothetical protein
MADLSDTAVIGIGMRGETGLSTEMLQQMHDVPLQPIAGIDGHGEESDTIGMDELQGIAQKTTIFIDTSALLDAGAETVLGRDLSRCLMRAGRKAYVLSRSRDHLRDYRNNAASPHQAAATKALRFLKEMQAGNLLEEIADPPGFTEQGFATRRMFVLMFLRYQISQDQTLITGDEATARQIDHNGHLEAIERSRPVNLYYVGDQNLKLWAPRLALADDSAPSRSASSTRDLKTIAQTCKVVVDTCSLMRRLNNETLTGAPYFSNVLLPLMRDAANPLIVPERVIRELQFNQGKPATAVSAAAGLDVLNLFETAGLLERGEDEHELGGTSTNFADPVFIQIAIKFSVNHDLCFITQDTNLAMALIANRQPEGGHATHVVYLEDRSPPVGLEAWEPKLKRIKKKRDADIAAGRAAPSKGPRRDMRPRTPSTSGPTPEPRAGIKPAPAVAARTVPFALSEHPRRTANVSLKVSRVPGVGDTVMGAKTGPVRLVHEIAAGGEGTIFETPDSSVVCKIYHADQLTAARKEKLELMLSRSIRIRGVCWPSDLVTTPQGEFLGYLMPKGEGKILKTAAFAKKLLQRNFPHWTREHLDQLAITILEAIESLHRLNIFIGDINAQNILVKDERTISLVDLDSVQVEGFPCPVGTDTFIPAHRQGQSFPDFLRSADDELFAVTTLLFMILFPGNAPYTSQGGGEAAENIRAHRFAYGRDADGRPPVGVWQFIWSHLRRDLQEDFTDVFRLDKRIPISALIKHLKLEQKDIHEGKRNPDIFPDKPRMREGDTVEALCDQCPPERNLHQITRAAAERIRERGRPFRCQPCSAMRKMNHLENSREVECALKLAPNCEGKTSAANSYLDMLARKGQDFRCRPCQAANRASQSRQACFVATATYRSEQAAPVQFLRAYRDTVLTKSRAGRAFIRAYYTVGPFLAKPVMHSTVLRRISKVLLDHGVRRLAGRYTELALLVRDLRHD